jgi:serine protease Do
MKSGFKVSLALGLAAIIALGSYGVTAVMDDYEARIDALNLRIEELQRQLSESPSSLELSTLSYTTGQENQSAADIAEQAGASVVGITITTQLRANTGWFSPPQVQEQTSKGSGVIISQEGYIVTNYHVVKSYIEGTNSQLEVYLADGRSAAASYVGGDEQNDLAVIKIGLQDLPVAQVGSSSDLRAGEFAMAIGSPLGMEGSVTVGVISGIDRKVAAENVAESLIQTDAAINPGNSGGALVDGQGKVIGINTIKIAATDVEGIGFAIPIESVMPIVESIMLHGYVQGRPATGIVGTGISNLTALFNNVPQGLLVTEVSPGSAADVAGIRQNDIILQLGGTDVLSMSDINQVLKQYKVGDVVEIEFYRGGSIYTATLTLLEGR